MAGSNGCSCILRASRRTDVVERLTEPAGDLIASRRMVTVLFADLKGLHRDVRPPRPGADAADPQRLLSRDEPGDHRSTMAA